MAPSGSRWNLLLRQLFQSLLAGLSDDRSFSRWRRFALRFFIALFSGFAGRLLLCVLHFFRLLAVEWQEPVLYSTEVTLLQRFIKVSSELDYSNDIESTRLTEGS